MPELPEVETVARGLRQAILVTRVSRNRGSLNLKPTLGEHYSARYAILKVPFSNA